MSGDVNRETGDRLQPIERPVSIRVGTEEFRFSVWLPPYIAGKLKPEDWLEAGKALRSHRDLVVQQSVMSGDWFMLGGVERARERVAQGMNDLIYERFKARQMAAGDLAWSVPSLLQGERFA